MSRDFFPFLSCQDLQTVEGVLQSSFGRSCLASLKHIETAKQQAVDLISTIFNPPFCGGGHAEVLHQLFIERAQFQRWVEMFCLTIFQHCSESLQESYDS